MQNLIDICLKASNAILEIYKKSNTDEMEIEYKSDNSPLTLADRKSHEIICSYLKEQYPKIPILSEEGSEIPYSERKEWDEFWLIDPIDGTKEFIKKNGEFTINIALIKDKKPSLGIVYAPALKKCWYGTDEGAFTLENGVKRRIQANLEMTEPIKVVASRSHSSPMLDIFLKSINDYELVSMGSSLKICLVADGSADIYPRLAPTMEWDTAAAHAILKSAGGNLIDLSTSKEMTYNRENLKNSYFIANSNMDLKPFMQK